ncbi:hypothetical protein TNCV_3629591 [Trichonephila clavipes]|nr:hypothetical protein TNCV_3629591 [Trichonephila clavipes]
MATVDFLHQENPPSWAGVEPETLGTERTATNQLRHPASWSPIHGPRVMSLSLVPLKTCRLMAVVKMNDSDILPRYLDEKYVPKGEVETFRYCYCKVYSNWDHGDKFNGRVS